jgi:RNA polymerase-binding transcription factor DksA
MTQRQLSYFESLLQYERDHSTRIHGGKKLVAVEEALDLLHEDPDHYGICVKCGRAIDSDRLRIVPATRYCEDDAERRPLAFVGPDTAW